MPRPNFLDRFRPVGSPGPAAHTGVPAVDAVGPETELAPVFAALAPDLERSRSRVDEARQAAARELAGARAAAEGVVARAELGSESARRMAYDRLVAASEEGDAEMLREAAIQAERITRRGRERLPGAIRRVIDSVLDEADT